MIEKTELVAMSKDIQVTEDNVQRDYVFGWVLAGVYRASDLGNKLVLKGGNCFRKAYFENARFSGDLDFSTQERISEEYLKAELGKVIQFVEQVGGIKFSHEIAMQSATMSDGERTVVKVKLYFINMFGKSDELKISVRLDIVELDKIYLPVQTRQLIHPYSDFKNCATEIRCVKLEEMLATKLKCLIQRIHIVDLYDLVYRVFFKKELDISRTEIINVFLRKTIFSPAPLVAKRLLAGISKPLLEKEWSKNYIACPAVASITFDDAYESFLMELDEIFSGYHETAAEVKFYSPEHRSLIMEAGREKVMLKMGYENQTRMIEPYALTYKVPQSGAGREYFYGYDTSGGNSGKKSIKTFFHEKIESMEITDVKFEPRCEIEVAKAGEPGKKTYFSRPFGRPKSESESHRPQTSARSSKTHGWVYIFQCAYCNRKFTRKEHSSKLNEHKDRYGNKCFGRFGSMVDRIYR